MSILEQYHYEAPASPPPKVSKVGVIIPSGQSDYYHTVLAQIGVFFWDRETGVVAMNTEGVPNYLPTALETLYDSNVQGIILVGCDYVSVRERLHSKIPHVWIDCNDTPKLTEKICQVQSDHLVSGCMVAQELLRKGCRNPIIFAGANKTHRSKDRLNGFVAEFAAKELLYQPAFSMVRPHSSFALVYFKNYM